MKMLVNRPVLVHASLRSFTTAQVSPADLAAAILDEGGTIFVPSFTTQYEQPQIMDHEFDEVQYSLSGLPRGSESFRHGSAIVDSNLGAFVEWVVKQSGRARGRHPLNSFTAYGPEAHNLISEADLYDVYSPIKRARDLGGYVLLCGVGYETATAIHLAQQEAGQKLPTSWAVGEIGELERFEVGGCSAGFGKFATVLDQVADHLIVHGSHWRYLPIEKLVDVSRDFMLVNPGISQCDDSWCLQCNAQKAVIQIDPVSV